MKYKRIIFISLLLSLIGLMCLNVFAEKEVLPIITWDKTYGGRGDDLALSLIQTTDGGYAVAGYTYSKGVGSADFWVIKLDNKGNKVWDKTYGGSDVDVAWSLIQTTDGGYAVAGYTYSKGVGSADFWVIKLDNKGNKVWDKTYGGRGDDLAFSLIQTTDGGYAVAGGTGSKGAGGVDLWVIKVDIHGNMIWDRTYGGSGVDAAYSLIQTTDGGYAVTGATFSKGAGGADLWVIKLDSQGNMIWDRTYGGSDADEAWSLIQTTDGGYAVAGSTFSKGAGGADLWVIKLDHLGNKIWDRTYGGSNDDGTYSLIQTADSGYAVAGETFSKGTAAGDFWVIKLDSQGNKIWDRTYGGSDADGAYSLIQTTDSGYVVAGGSFSKGAGGTDFWVIKLDVQGTTWEKFTSTEGAFSVLMPGTPTKEKQTENTQWGPVDLYFFIVEREDVVYMVDCVDYPQSFVQQIDPEVILDNARNAGVANAQGTLLSEHIISLEEYPGRELRIKYPTLGGEIIVHTRIFLVDNRLYQIAVTTQREESFSEDIGKFFDSFALLDK